MAPHSPLSGRKAIMLFATALAAGILGTLVALRFASAFQTSPAWIGPSLVIGLIAAMLLGVLLLSTAVRAFGASRRVPGA